VVIAIEDPFEQVNGQGIAKLQAAGIEVISGVLAAEAARQNEIFLTYVNKQRPFVLYKSAMTLDGKIATYSGHSQWVTGEAARAKVQQWRHELDAIAVGINTVLADDPRLTCRLAGGRSPRKVIFDSNARTPLEARLFAADEQGQAAKVIIFVSQAADERRVSALQAKAEVYTCASEARVDVSEALHVLKQRELSSLLLEGGSQLAWSFLAARAIDKVAFFIAPKLVGGQAASPLAGQGVASMDQAIELSDMTTDSIGADLLVSGYPQWN
jgi:diaminohydroxyphosphoribosylaminopyrimidine deaminase/5-amino-6-(5-phosphoribosylamino)uracil reductase